jgi:hypothetical protein
MGYAVHEGIKRTSAPLAVFVPAQVVYGVQPETGKSCFTCPRLHATLSVSACGSQFLRGQASCIGCKVGKLHAIGRTPKLVRAEPGVPVYAQPQSCIRCGRTGSDEHSIRIAGRFRTVHKASMFFRGAADFTTICVGCYNRAQECRPNVMRNSKGATPKKHAAFLRDASISFTVGKKKYADVQIGLRSGVPEIRRLLERAYPGADVKLTEVRFNCAVADLNSTDDPLWVANKPRKQPAKYTRTAKPAVVAKPVEQISPAWADVFGETAPVAKKRGTPAKNPMEQAEYAESLGAIIRDAQRDPYGMRDLAQWLLEGVARGPWRYEAPAIKAATPSAAIPATVAPAEVAERISEPAGPVADALNSIEPIAEDEQVQSEWAGCSADGVLVTDYAREHGLTDDAAAIELGMCDPDDSDEPEPAAAPEPEPAPEPVKAEPAPKRLTGKQQRKLEKAQRRAERIQQRRPSAPKQIAVTARAYIEVMFEMGARK